HRHRPQHAVEPARPDAARPERAVGDLARGDQRVPAVQRPRPLPARRRGLAGARPRRARTLGAEARVDALTAILLTEDHVRTVMAEPGATMSAIDALEQAIAAYARGEVSSSPRVHVGEGGERSGRALRVLPSGTACRIYTMNKEAGPGAPAPCELIVLFDEAMA